MTLTYHWQAMLVTLAGVIIVTKLVNSWVLRSASLKQTVALNLEMDNAKKEKDKYPPVITQNNQVGAIFMAILYFAVTPFFADLSNDRAWWRFVTDGIVILMVYDFFYYLTHRFLFHGNAYFRKVHGLHHQARDPSYVDNFYVHPLETAIGLTLIVLSVVLTGLVFGLLGWGYTFSAFTLIPTYYLYTHINTVNHIKMDLPFAPFKLVNWMSYKHHLHHIDMNHGNYASITLFFDWAFGTLEK